MSEPNPIYVQLTQKRYNELVRAEQKLDALETQGVDNWDGYSEAMQSLDDDK